MSTGTPSLVIIGAFVAGAGLGWFGRGWWDGSTVSATDAQAEAQAAVDVTHKAASQIERAANVAEAARMSARKAIEVRYVDRACPPGVGAVSADVGDRLRAAFGQEARAADPP